MPKIIQIAFSAEDMLHGVGDDGIVYWFNNNRAGGKREWRPLEIDLEEPIY